MAIRQIGKLVRTNDCSFMTDGTDSKILYIKSNFVLDSSTPLYNLIQKGLIKTQFLHLVMCLIQYTM